MNPGQEQSITIGDVQGSVYTVKNGSDMIVIATFQSAGSEHPVRLVAHLAPGQQLSLSAGDAPGQEGRNATLFRSGEALMIDNPQPLHGALNQALR